MRSVLVLAALTLSAAVPAAPRLPPEPSVSSEAEVYRALVGPAEIAKTEMRVTFAVHGKKGATYTVELYVEASGTGEKAEWVRTATVRPDGRPKDEQGTATGEFKLRSRSLDEAESAARPHLPNPSSSLNWSYLLLLKEGKQIVASFGPGYVPFVRKDVRVPE